MKILYFCCTFIWMATLNLYSQCNNLPPASAFTINGTAASIGNNEFKLTDDAKAQAGSIWFSHYLNLDDDFKLEFDVFLGNNEGGADGMAFVMQQSAAGVAALSKGGGLGYKGIAPSFSVEYDTWRNSDYGDPISDHVSLMKNGNVIHDIGSDLGLPSFAMNMEDGKYHRTVISWTASTRTIKVFWDSDFVPTITKVVDLKSGIFSGNPYVYWGWTGSTGDAKNLQKVKLVKVDFTEVLFLEGRTTAATCKNADGYIDLTVQGGVEPFTYKWSNGSADQDLFNLIGGTYSVEVKDACGNSGKAAFTVFAEKATTTLVCPSNLLLDNTPGKCATDFVTYAQPTLKTCMGGASDAWIKQTGGLPSGATFPMGTTENTFIVMTAKGAGATCTFMVTVQ